jgi:hypothetical protein
MSRPKLELGSNNKMFNSALKHIKRLPKDEWTMQTSRNTMLW